ncbi:formate hydrogenlyase subunit 4 [Burkholderia pseudomallei 1710b]|nr:formate hydrogenlyase subunit 4 [Burkholderia pseudomallei 1710b]
MRAVRRARVARARLRRTREPAPHRCDRTRPLPARRAGRARARGARPGRRVRRAVERRAAARAARPAVPSACRSAVRILPVRARRGDGGRRRVLVRLLPQGRGHGARPHLLRVPRVRREHGAAARRGRCVLLHGRVGDADAVGDLPRDDEPPDRRDPPRRIRVFPDLARRRARAAAVLRPAAGGHGRLHVREHAHPASRRARRIGRVRARARRLRREGRHLSAARLAAGRASGRAVAGIRAAERLRAEDRPVWNIAHGARSAARAGGVVGRAHARARPVRRVARRRVQHDPDRHEAAARLFVDRQRRPDVREPRAHDPVPRLPAALARRAVADGAAVSDRRARVLQEPAVPRHGRRAARDGRAQSRPARRLDPLHAVDRVGDARRRRRERRAAAVERLRVRMAARAELPVHAGAAGFGARDDGAARRGARRADGGARRLRDGQVLRHRVPRPAARGQARARARREPVGADRVRLVRGRERAARPRARSVREGARCAHARARRRGHRGHESRVAAVRARVHRARELHAGALHAVLRRVLRARVAARAALLSRQAAARGAVVVRQSVRDRAHAGHGRRLRPADPRDLHAVLPDRAATAVAVRSAAGLPDERRGPHVAPAVRADRRARKPRRRARRAVADGPHRDLSDVQLHRADRPSDGGETMVSASGILSQTLEILVALAAAPLLTGWVNQCRAWLQNRRAPSIWQPYRMLHKLFNKESVVAEHASPLFRGAPYVVWAAMALACAIVPTLSTELPFSPAADAIALVGLFALARVALSLAAMDIGTAFGTLGARREMLIGFLAEPALLMVLFSASLITRSTLLTSIVAALGHRELAIYPSLAFAGIAFTLVSLAENARLPVDNPATHLELTMIHEALILEYSGRHLALMEWAASLKLFAYSCIGLALFMPWGIAEAGSPLALLLALPALFVKLLVGGAALAVVETTNAKMRLFRVPEFLASAFLLAVIGMLVHFLLGA